MIVLKNKEHLAKKKHICNFCCNPINIGQKYNYQTGINDGFYVWKSHINCNKLSYILNMYEDHYDEGVSSDFFSESIIEKYKDIKGRSIDLPDFNTMLNFIIDFYIVK